MTDSTIQFAASSAATKPRNRPLAAKNFLLLCVWILSFPFMYHAYTHGMSFILDPNVGVSPFDSPLPYFALLMMATHMVMGAAMNCLAPLQIHLGISNKTNGKLHRWVGVAVLLIAIFGATAGSLYFTLYQISVFEGKPHQTYSTYQAGAMYGVVMFYVIYKSIQSLVQKNYRVHREWAIRLFMLAVGSWIARIMRGWLVWFFAAGEVTGNPVTIPVEFLVMLYAWSFYVLPLAAYEIYLWGKRRKVADKMPSYFPFGLSLACVLFLTIGTAGYLLDMFYLSA
ncbi:MAG: DUF2306 domain-containing protein [Shimia thalassica]|uniref:DUF2306 domain-containing protein n=1 Tax=Shimia thalassica TaxID=1715693 RepID=UPI003298211D